MPANRPEKTVQKGVERYLPKHLMAFVADSVMASGFEFREDILANLVTGAAADITSYDKDMQEPIIATIDSLMPGMKRTLPNEGAPALLTSALFLLKLVDRGLYRDAKSVAVITALLIVEEAKDDQEFWGMKIEQADKYANNLITTCNLKGLYLTSPVQ